MAGRGTRLAPDPLQRAFQTLYGGPDGPIAFPPDLFPPQRDKGAPSPPDEFYGHGFVGGPIWRNDLAPLGGLKSLSVLCASRSLTKY
jgi:hypothetical protein